MKESTTKKPQILILGTFHMGETSDLIKTEVDDLLSEQRQNEIINFAKQIASFKPTKLAVEIETKYETDINKDYQDYLEGNSNLALNEVYQLGFRIAEREKHEKIFCVDWMEQGVSTRSIGEVYNWAKENQPVLFEEIFGGLEKETKNTNTGTIVKSILEMYREHNAADFVKEIHQSHLNIAKIKGASEYIGIDWLIWWYQRNLILFSNLASLAQSSDDRILFIVGSGHVEILTNFLRESGGFDVESINDYLYE